MQLEARYGKPKVFTIGVIASVLGLCLTGVSLITKQLWLLYVAYVILMGIGGGAIYITGIHASGAWGISIGQKGLLVGFHGFMSGLWPAMFSFIAFWQGGGVVYGFFLTAAAVFVLSLLGAGLLSNTPGIAPATTTTTAAANSSNDLKGAQSAVAAKADSTTATTTTATTANTITGGATASTTPSTSTPSTTSSSATSTTVSATTTTSTTTSATTAAAADTDAPRVLSTRDQLMDWRFYVYALAILGSLFGGFGVKFLVAPIMGAVYQASTLMQVFSSFAFLLSYSLMRLMAGIFADRYPVNKLFAAATLYQVPLLLSLGFVVRTPGQEAAFITLIALLGMCLAAAKVTGVSLMTIWIYRPRNFVVAFGPVIVVFAMASVIGPVTNLAPLVQFKVSSDCHIIMCACWSAMTCVETMPLHLQGKVYPTLCEKMALHSPPVSTPQEHQCTLT